MNNKNTIFPVVVENNSWCNIKKTIKGKDGIVRDNYANVYGYLINMVLSEKLMLKDVSLNFDKLISFNNKLENEENYFEHIVGIINYVELEFKTSFKPKITLKEFKEDLLKLMDRYFEKYPQIKNLKEESVKVIEKALPTSAIKKILMANSNKKYQNNLVTQMKDYHFLIERSINDIAYSLEHTKYKAGIEIVDSELNNNNIFKIMNDGFNEALLYISSLGSKLNELEKSPVGSVYAILNALNEQQELMKNEKDGLGKEYIAKMKSENKNNILQIWLDNKSDFFNNLKAIEMILSKKLIENINIEKEENLMSDLFSLKKSLYSKSTKDNEIHSVLENSKDEVIEILKKYPEYENEITSFITQTINFDMIEGIRFEINKDVSGKILETSVSKSIREIKLNSTLSEKENKVRKNEKI